MAEPTSNRGSRRHGDAASARKGVFGARSRPGEPPQGRKGAYRSDIDGLRAIAVLSVIGYHIDARLVPGGFTGVDIFFVISGFLISGLIFKGLAKGTFSLGTFYARRIKRIVPASFLLLAVVFAAGLVLLAPPDFRNLSRAAVYALFSASNIYFWEHVDTSYFAPTTDDLPLLHTWSLGVEEQFYLVWPLTLMLTAKLRPRVRFALFGLLCLGSFLFAQHMAKTAPTFSFYMLPTRAGELLLGAIAAMLPLRGAEKTVPGRWTREVAAWLGCALLLYSFVRIDKASVYPGFNTLPACLGTVLLIASGATRTTFASRLLSTRVLAGIGLLSYSLYLWHWPVLAYVRYFHTTIPWPLALAALGAAAALAAASYALVEYPLRYAAASRKSVYIGYYVLPVCLFLALGTGLAHFQAKEAIVQNDDGYGQRLRALEAETAEAQLYAYDCQLSAFDAERFSDPRCVVGRDAPPAALLWGDSHAAHYVGLLGAAAEDAAFAFRNISHSECPPILGQDGKYGGARRESCTLYRQRIAKELDRYDAVFMAAAWSGYAGVAGFWEDVAATFDALRKQGKRVYVFAQVPVFPAYNRQCDIRNMSLHLVDCRALSGYADGGEAEHNRKLRAVAAAYDNVTVVDVGDLLCQDGWCSPYAQSQPLYHDTHHLSMSGSWLLGRRLVAAGAARSLFSDVGRRPLLGQQERSGGSGAAQ